jgi:hypothetical protein
VLGSLSGNVRAGNFPRFRRAPDRNGCQGLATRGCACALAPVQIRAGNGSAAAVLALEDVTQQALSFLLQYLASADMERDISESCVGGVFLQERRTLLE